MTSFRQIEANCRNASDRMFAGIFFRRPNCVIKAPSPGHQTV